MRDLALQPSLAEFPRTANALNQGHHMVAQSLPPLGDGSRSRQRRVWDRRLRPHLAIAQARTLHSEGPWEMGGHLRLRPVWRRATRSGT